MAKYKVDQFIAAIPKSAGIVSTIAARVGCHWMTARKFIDTHPSVLAAYNAERESVLDMAEATLFKSIQDGNTQDAKWLLKSLGKHRGYGEIYDGRNGELIWRQEIIELLESGRITPAMVLDELGHDLATELFVAAGVPVSQARATEESG